MLSILSVMGKGQDKKKNHTQINKPPSISDVKLLSENWPQITSEDVLLHGLCFPSLTTHFISRSRDKPRATGALVHVPFTSKENCLVDQGLPLCCQTTCLVGFLFVKGHKAVSSVHVRLEPTRDFSKTPPPCSLPDSYR